MKDQAVVFFSGQEEYSLPIEHVLSIEKIDSIHPLSHLQGYVKGVVKVRNELIPIIDFEYLLYERELNRLDDGRLIVIRTDSLTFGIFVKEAKEIINIPPGSIKQVGLIAYGKTKYFSSVVHLENRLITMIDPDILVSSLDGIKEIEDYMTNYRSDDGNVE
ncbi:purine-binding chemotaxis protein CheW [Oikeobacillus pervagus]|uniref:Purine-binding chemotaxis protein CheW n=1 Tax=Oikeobacillus pervagus TaxID=1325931 RepID=A0AAJ1WHY4_9BACI|nr:CheW domain-containing protein [Oikeobacillus pervagus]MDQ0213793.1 purine-binding chemotaxis protein CheW [Oikeobacillus pervagus]